MKTISRLLFGGCQERAVCGWFFVKKSTQTSVEVGIIQKPVIEWSWFLCEQHHITWYFFTRNQTLSTVRKLCKMENFCGESFMEVFHFSKLSLYGYWFLSCRLVCNSFIDFVLLFPVKSLTWDGLGIKNSLLIGW